MLTYRWGGGMSTAYIGKRGRWTWNWIERGKGGRGGGG